MKAITRTQNIWQIGASALMADSACDNHSGQPCDYIGRQYNPINGIVDF